jgi:hypothetical protein
MDYKEFKQALLNTRWEPNAKLLIGEDTPFPELFPLKVEDTGISCVELPGDWGYTWEELELMATTGRFDNTSTLRDETLVTIKNKDYIIRFLAVTPLENLL